MDLSPPPPPSRHRPIAAVFWGVVAALLGLGLLALLFARSLRSLGFGRLAARLGLGSSDGGGGTLLGSIRSAVGGSGKSVNSELRLASARQRVATWPAVSAIRAACSAPGAAPLLRALYSNFPPLGASLTLEQLEAVSIDDASRWRQLLLLAARDYQPERPGVLLAAADGAAEIEDGEQHVLRVELSEILSRKHAELDRQRTSGALAGIVHSETV